MYRNQVFEERNGRRSRGPSPNTRAAYSGDSSDDDLSGSDSDNGMRVGVEYQVLVPDFNPQRWSDSRAEAMLVWAPSSSSTDNDINTYLKTAKENYGYNHEQALGMLFWHKHDMTAALADLPNFTPFPDEWSVEDKVLFEQAFCFHGKNFIRIRQMLPDKTFPQLIKYYYSWKKTRTRTSLMDKHARKFGGEKEESDEDGESSSESECESLETIKKDIKRLGRPGPASKKYDAPRSKKLKRKLPRSMYMDFDELRELAEKPPEFGEEKIKDLEVDLKKLKSVVQSNKQNLSSIDDDLREKDKVNDTRPPSAPQKYNARWSNDELLLAVQGIRTYGRDFKAIAEVLGNKSDAHVRNFFVKYRRQYNLDQVLAHYEKEHGIKPIEEKPKETMDVDEDKDERSDQDDPPTPEVMEADDDENEENKEI